MTNIPDDYMRDVPILLSYTTNPVWMLCRGLSLTDTGSFGTYASTNIRKKNSSDIDISADTCGALVTIPQTISNRNGLFYRLAVNFTV